MKKQVVSLMLSCLVVVSAAGCSQTSAKGVSKEMDTVISNYIVEKYKGNLNNPTDKGFEAHKIYGSKKMNDKTTVYLQYFYEGFSYSTKAELETGSVVPASITLKEKGNSYEVVDYQEPGDGEMFEDGLKKLFPSKYVKKAIHDQSNAAGLNDEMDKKVKEWEKEKKKS
ncbi:hypothetical protein [Gottfriedia acidiceleris]|uniref:hypothetical protein n=1 Tax=Gottfriedia acidiceleris TaxID=371036 RepID=UPI000B44FD9F|nr:hypothetical protein [Gottfriedia acidiceleris]